MSELHDSEFGSAYKLTRARFDRWLSSAPTIFYCCIPLAALVGVGVAQGYFTLPWHLPFIALAASAFIASVFGGLLAAQCGSVAIVAYVAYAMVNDGLPIGVSNLLATIGVTVVAFVSIYLGSLREANKTLLKRLTQSEASLLEIDQTMDLAVKRRTKLLEETNSRLEMTELDGRDLVRRLRSMTRAWLSAEEKERRRIARELHDEVGQSLAALNINLSRVREYIADSADADKIVVDSKGIVADILTNVRQLLLDLRPPLVDDFGLTEAIRLQSTQNIERAGLRVTFDIADSDRMLDEGIETAIFRITQEAVNNAIMHARAREITITLRISDEWAELIVHDDGKGFDTSILNSRRSHPDQFGLLGMRERTELLGGEFSIQSGKGTGASVRARFPLGVVVPSGDPVATDVNGDAGSRSFGKTS